MELYTRAYTGLAVQLAQYFGIPLEVLNHSTLNEALDVQAGATLGTNELPRVNYFGIGNGGHKHESGIDSFPLLSNKIHRSRDTGLFNQIPFVLRPIDNDLTSIQRKDYALRKLITHAGNSYFAYYLKRLDKSNLSIKVQDRVIDNNQNTVISDFIPSSNDLKPTPVDLANAGVNTVTGKYISASVNLVIKITAFDAEEIINACEILYSNSYYALISELVLVSGVDRQVSVSDGLGGIFNFDEAICTQVAEHIPVLQPVFSQRDGFTIAAEVGGIEPLLNIDLASP